MQQLAPSRHFSLVKEKKQDNCLRPFSYDLIHCKQARTSEIQQFIPCLRWGTLGLHETCRPPPTTCISYRFYVPMLHTVCTSRNGAAFANPELLQL